MSRLAGRFGVAAVVAVTLLTALSGCRDAFTGLRLSIATGGTQGVYYVLGNTLADAWTGQLGIPRPTVLSTAASVDNVDRLRAGTADVGFSAADVASAAAAGGPRPGQHAIRALARIYDDYVQLVVRADVPARRLADLRGLRVSIGLPNSGVQVIAQRLLTAAGLSEKNDLQAQQLGIDESLNALRDGRIDAFFWSGGLPTGGVTELAKSVPLRMLDLSDVVPTLRQRYPDYSSATVPASAYGLPNAGPVTTLVVHNYLLVTDAMPDDVAEALVRGVFDAQPALVKANVAARSIDVRAAIETAPVPLHPGALRYYRAVKV
ncbi:TAXI family TRAP transporter solute-binding subunit [Gandjariella thermophila]|uniref:TAXI family TRAP transporter solute-binding subunit n=1 Tax=Gandjariella thermophila TaxID=1931992 RepID=UPI0026A8C378|nr:TAXI family TRAP transporter solute-binding subunit [Gandjariella thermophila]